MNITEIDKLRLKLQDSFNLLIDQIGIIQIGKKKQFPYGWRKAAKGRTVWRIVEELITQNLEKYHSDFKISQVIPSTSEVSVHDMICQYEGEPQIFVNIKSAVIDGRKNKDDISKADGLIEFYNEDRERQFFVGTFFIQFLPNMAFKIEKAVVFPIAWIPDIYVNPSNNGNLQSAYYKDISDAVKRTNAEFLPLFYEAVEIAKNKKIRNIEGH